MNDSWQYMAAKIGSCIIYDTLKVKKATVWIKHASGLRRFCLTRFMKPAMTSFNFDLAVKHLFLLISSHVGPFYWSERQQLMKTVCQFENSSSIVL